MAKFTYRFLIYGVVILYILLDLQVFKGPMHTWMMTKRGKDPATLRAEGVAATVYGQAILESQVEYRMKEYLYTRGRTIEDLSKAEHPLVFRYCLENLITEHLIRIKAHYNQSQLSKSPSLQQEIENHSRYAFDQSFLK